MNLKQIVEQLKWCGYECEAGPLENNTAFVELVERSEREEGVDGDFNQRTTLLSQA